MSQMNEWMEEGEEGTLMPRGADARGTDRQKTAELALCLYQLTAG